MRDTEHQEGLSPALLSVPLGAAGVDLSRSFFGAFAGGRPVESITLTNSRGIRLTVITLGASIQSLLIPDREGQLADVVLGYDDLTGYLARGEYFGATVGRFANRIAKGRFTLEGKTYQLATNNGPNALHGGVHGFDKALWTVKALGRGPTASVTLEYLSPDGDEGYPGNLTVTAIYGLNERDEVSVEYRATTDRPTIVNLSNHAYFNLAGEDSGQGVMGHLLRLPAEEYLPVDATLIPTGEFRAVGGTPFDFRQPKAIGRDLRDGRDAQIVHGRGYDHNWVLGRAPSATPTLVARVEEPVSGRVMEMFSNQPGLQFYSGNFLDGTVVGKSGHAYRQSDAFALEPQRFPDTPNRPEFGSARLDPGATYVHQIMYRFSVANH